MIRMTQHSISPWTIDQFHLCEIILYCKNCCRDLLNSSSWLHSVNAQQNLIKMILSLSFLFLFCSLTFLGFFHHLHDLSHLQYYWREDVCFKFLLKTKCCYTTMAMLPLQTHLLKASCLIPIFPQADKKEGLTLIWAAERINSTMPTAWGPDY